MRWRGTRLASVTGRIGLGFVARAWSQLAALALGLIAACVLGKADFGTYTIASAFVVLLQALMYGGLYDFLIKERQVERGTDDTCFWMNLSFGMLSTVVLAACSVVIDRTISEAAAALLLRLAPTTIIAAVASWQEAILLRRGQVRRYYAIWIAVETISSMVALTSLLRGGGLDAFVLYRYLLLTSSCLAYAIAVRHAPRLFWDWGVARRVWAFAANIYVGRIVGIGANYGGDILIGALVSPSAAGSYRLASRIAFGISEMVYQPASTIAWVQFAEAGRGGRAMLTEWRQLIVFLSFTAWAALAVLVFNASSVVSTIVGPGWGDAASVLQVLALARIVALAEIFLDPALGVLDRTATILRVRLASAVLALAMIAAFTRFGVTGAAAAQLVLETTLAAVTLKIFVDAKIMDWKDVSASFAPGTGCVIAVALGQTAFGYLRAGATQATPEMLAVAVGVAALSWTLFLGAWILLGTRSKQDLRHLPV